MTVTDDDLDPGLTGDSAETDPSPSKDVTKSEFVPPKDGSYVPRERLNQVLAKVEALSKQIKEQNAPKPVSRKELLDKVNVGEITQYDADDIWQGQNEKRMVDQVETVVRDTAVATKLQDELSSYEKRVPELGDENSDLYRNVANEYQYLVHELGMPDGTSTTLAAVRSVVGPANALKKIDIKTQTGAGHPENSGSGDSGNQNPAGDKPQLSARQKDYYSNGIRMGAYKDWAEVHKELEGYQR